MRLGTLAVESGRCTRRSLAAAGWVAAFLFAAGCLATPVLEAQGTLAGTRFRNWATLTYTAGGQGYVVASDTVEVVVGQIAAVDLQPPRVSSGAPGTAVVFAHTLMNLGNGPDSFTVTGVSTRGWPVTLYHDVNGNGILDAGDSALTAPVVLGYGGVADLLAQVAIPSSGTAGVSDTVTVTATSRFNPAVSAAVPDRVDVSGAPLVISLSKQVDRPTAVAGDVLTYTLSYATTGSAAASNVELADTIPAGASYVPGTMRWDGVPLSDAAGDDAGIIAPTGNGVVVVSLGSVAPGATGSVTFQVRVNPGPARTVDNRSNTTYAWAGGADTTLSNTVQTTVLVSILSLDKQLTSPSPALVGQQVRYTLRYANAAGAAPAQNVVLTDTLPAGLQYVSATAPPVVAGQVLSWSLGTLADGDSGVIDLLLTVAPTVRDTVLVRNLAFLDAQNTTALSAAAAQVALIGPPTTALGVGLSADVLEVGVGQVIPYSVTVTNPGTLPVTSIRVATRLPPGTRYVPGSAIGADSSFAAGGQLVLFTAAALAPSASRTLRFVIALVSAPGAVVEARATATGQVSGGQAASPEAIAWVQVRRAWPMETRAAIGKVWVDADGNGVQGFGDAGLAGIDIWTEDGEVATTDSTGKFSFANLRPGQHAFRLDPRSLSQDYHLASDDIQIVAATGWTTARVDFRVVPVVTGRAEQPQPAERGEAGERAQPDERRPPAAQLPATAEAGDSVEFTFLAAPVHRRDDVRYEVTVRQPRARPLDVLVDFAPVPDSAVVYRDGVEFTRYSWIRHQAIPIPPARPGAEIKIVAWSAERGDSAAMLLYAIVPLDSATTWPHVRRPVPVARGVVHNTVRPVVLKAWMSDHAGELSPAVAPLTLGATADTTLSTAAPETVFVAPARTAADRAAEDRASLVRGPGVTIFAPADGAVLGTDRVYVGVKGERGATAVLYDGTAPIDTAQVRIDGVLDFIAVPLARGPHRLRVQMKNGWGNERWDSVAVHVTGLPARFEVPPRVTLTADGRSVVVAHVRVRDAWGVPVVQPAYVTVAARGAKLVGRDADPSSVGLQLLSAAAGRLAVALKPGHAVEAGVLELKSGDATAQVPIEILPEVRPLTVAGSGRVGVGASSDAYGALTARGRLDTRTSLTLTLDSRRVNAGEPSFGRSQDPLAEAQYPILGDASHVETRAASRDWFSARLERGFDWVSVGDVATSDFANGLSLAGYRRAVSGAAARFTTGAVTWSGFGSLTTQSLRQRQIRGAGVSGPYELGPDVLPGTEYLRIETRALDNPERAVVTQALTRFVDYQIDYVHGVVLFKQPVPAADADGNPLYILATYEAATGGEQRLVAGGRAALDVKRVLGAPRLDSLRLGVTAVNAGQAVADYRLVGADVRALRVGGLDLAAEIAYAEQGDSAGVATAVKASYQLPGGAVTVGAAYMSVGREFTNPSNVALRPGTTELNLRGALSVGPSTLRAEHSRQRFELDGVDRQHTRVGIVQSVGRRLELDGGFVNDRVESAAGGSPGGEAQSAEFKASWRQSDRLQLWAGGRRSVTQSGELSQPDYYGFGSAYRVTQSVALEAGQRFVTQPSGGDYAVSNVGVRANVGSGTQAWGSYQLSGGISGARNAAVVGLNNRLRLTPALVVNLLFERRVGVGGAPLADPVRALPFLQAEDDYWSAGAGLELAPERGAYRLSARGEYKDGLLQSNRLVTVAGDVAFDASFAVLSRQEFVQSARPGAPLARRLSSLWGLALRPARTDRVNMLAKLQWTEDRNPIGGGVLVSQGGERKLIGAAEVIWTPVPGAELGTRYAVRRTQAERLYPDGTAQQLGSWADYVGSHVSVDVTRWLALRGDGRLLVERTSGTQRWDGAPAIALRLVNGLEIVTGYRFGNLRDPDFAVRGGHGAFLTLSAGVTEKSFPTAAAFWRPRF